MMRDHFKIKKGMVLLLIFVTCLCASACKKKEAGKGETSDMAQEEIKQEYVASFQTISGDSTGDYYNAKLRGKYLYFRCYDDDSETWIIRRADSETNEEKDLIKWNGEGSSDGRWSVCTFDVTKDGHLLTLYGLHEEAEAEYLGKAKEYLLATFDENGNLVSSLPVEDGLVSDEVYSPRMGVDGNGNVCLEGKESLLLVVDGKKKGEIQIGDNAYLSRFARSTNGTLYVFTQSGVQSCVYEINFQTAEMVRLEDVPQHINGIWEKCGEVSSEAGNVLLVSDDDGLVGIDVSGKKTYDLATWSDFGIHAAMVRNVSMYGDRIYACCNESGTGSLELAILKPQDNLTAAEVPEKPEVMTVAVIKKNTILSNMVSDYNRSQKKYRVEVVEYGKNTSSSLEWQDVINRMMADVLGDNPPDVMDVTSPVLLNMDPSLEDLMDKAYVDDLNPYLERSQKISKEDFEPKIIEAFTCPKGLPAIPTTYDIDAVIVPRQEFGDGLGWKISDLIAYDHAHPNLPPMNNCNRSAMCALIIMPNVFNMIDWDEGQAHFDCKEFREMMEYAASFPEGDGYYSTDNYSGNQLLQMTCIETLFKLEYAQKAYFGKNAKLIGYPTVDGKPLTIISPDTNGLALAICSRSHDKEGAWDFVEYVLEQNPHKQSYEFRQTFGGIPTNLKILQEDLALLSSPEGPLNIGLLSVAGVQSDPYLYDPFSEEEPDGMFRTYPFTEEEEKLLRELLDAAQVNSQEYKKIKSIVWSECKEYFSGKRNLDQTVDAIQSRVQLYLNEQQ